MKLATIRKLLRENPSDLTVKQIGEICLYNYFSEETDKGSIFNLDQLSELIVSKDMDKTQQVYMYIKMIASLRHMRLIAERYYEVVLKVLEENLHAISQLGFFLYKYQSEGKTPPYDDILINDVKTNYSTMLELCKIGKDELTEALQTVLAYNEIIEIIKEHYKLDIAEGLKIDTKDIEGQMDVIHRRGQTLKLPSFFKEYIFLGRFEDIKLNPEYMKLAKKFVVRIENYNTFLPTGYMLLAFTEGYDEFIK